MQKYETGERDIAKAEAATVCRLAKILNTSVEELVGYEIISYEELKEHINKYELDISGATYFAIGYCGSLNKTIIDWIYKIIDEREQA